MMALKTNNTFKGELRINEPMSKHTSWRVGGPADQYYKPIDVADLALFLSTLGANEAITWVGLGSNLLVRDAGIRGTVIATSGMLNEIDQLSPSLSHSESNLIRAEAGVSCAKVARFSARLGLVGAEFLAGIPGTIGGALAMNAGAFGGETWDIVKRVEVIGRSGKLKQRNVDEYDIAYRSVCGPENEWFVAAEFQLSEGDSEQAAVKIKKLLAQRSDTQPIQMPNAGSVFRNPDNDFSARLIEACGLKGKSIGGASVSEKHANFIINTGTATANDIEQLISEVQHIVKQEQGVLLETEVRFVGDKKPN